MKKYIYFLLFIMLSFGTAYADNKKDLFDDYGIYTKEMDEQIITVKKEVYTEIYNIKKLMLENNVRQFEKIKQKTKHAATIFFMLISFINI